MKSNFKIIYDIITKYKRELVIVDEIICAIDNDEISFRSIFRMFSTNEMLSYTDAILIGTTEGFKEIDRKEWLTKKICDLMLV